MNIRVCFKCFIFTVCLSAAFLVLPKTVYAVPGKGTGDVPYTSEGCKSKTFDLIKPEDLPSDGNIGIPKIKGKKAEGEIEEPDTESYIPLVMIVVGLDNIPYDNNYDWGSYIFREERSLDQYYRDMSFNKFTFRPVKETSAFGVDDNSNIADVVNDGVIHVSVDKTKTRGWSTDDEDGESASEMLDAFAKALTKAKEYIDFPSYDSDQDGKIDTSELAIGFVVAGRDAANEAGKTTDLYMYTWPHAYSYSEYQNLYQVCPDAPLIDGVIIDDYIAISEKYRDNNGEYVQEYLGTLAHELGHYLGLPDLYSTTSGLGSWRSYDSSFLSLMNQGCYGTDVDGSPIPYSLDIWSRALLGWVEPVQVGSDDPDVHTNDKWSLRGSLDASGDTSTDAPVAARLNTAKEGEYYLFENRRFTSWDKGMSNYYSEAATSEEGEDLGGGILIWHIDNNMYEKYKADNMVNASNHHPAVRPVYRELEEDDEGEISSETLIGTLVSKRNPFFARDTWSTPLFLPMYGSKERDKPSDRIPAFNLMLSVDSNSEAVMNMHRHYVLLKRNYLTENNSLMVLWGSCSHCRKIFNIDRTRDITYQLITKPTSTEEGEARYTGRFAMYAVEDMTVDVDIPPLDPEVINARSTALEELTDVIIKANAALAGENHYTQESIKALNDAIKAASALFEDDSATDEDVKAAQAELIKAWRLLELSDTNQEAEEAKREALRDAICELAQALVDIYSRIDPDIYKPAAYTAFCEKTDPAYEILGNPDAEAGEILDMKTQVMRAWTALEKNGHRISIEKASIASIPAFDYDGNVKEPKPQVSIEEKTLEEGVDYNITYNNNTNAGTGIVTITGIGDYKGELKAEFTIRKISQSFTVKVKSPKIKYAKVKKAKQTITKVLTVKNAKGKVTYVKIKGKKQLKVNKKNGKLTIKKGTRKGVYKIKIRITAAGDTNYNPLSKTIVVTVKVKK